jgi:hypothetical protein
MLHSRPKLSLAKQNIATLLSIRNSPYMSLFQSNHPVGRRDRPNTSKFYRCLKIISSIIPYSLACSGFMM